MNAIVALDEIAGIPAHPLLVHAAVVLIPLAAITMLIAIWKKYRRPMLIATAVLASAGAIFVLAAASTGESLQERVDRRSEVRDHAEAGDRAQAPAVIFASFAVLALGADLLRNKNKQIAGKQMPTWAPTALLAATVLTGAISTYTVFDAGHSGAKAVWEDRAGTAKNGGDSDD